MTKQNKLIERIETKLQIKYPSPRFVEEIIHYLEQKIVDIPPALNIKFDQNKEALMINIEYMGAVEPVFKFLDALLIHIREKEEMPSKERYQLDS